MTTPEIEPEIFENRIVFRCLPVKQPIGSFYIGAIDASDLVAIAYADIRRIEQRDIELYLGIQRTLNDARVRELNEYARTVDATFPTSVILAISPEHAVYDERLGIMTLPRIDSIAKIIDGQHRIAGLKGYRGPTFEVNVTIFVEMEIEDQANVFATINLSQTKVSKSLAYDLYEFAKARSPQKTAHNVVRLLNREEGSPFKDRIKILGVATPGRQDETLTQAAVVDRVLPLISDKPIADRDTLKRGKELAPTPREQMFTLIFREMFREQRDEDIALVIWNYFSAIQRRWPYAWNTVEQGNILNRTTGFRGFMRYLIVANRIFNQPNQVPPVGFFENLLSRVTLLDSDFTPDRFNPGTSGESALAKTLIEQSPAV